MLDAVGGGGVGDAELGDAVGAGHADALAGGRQVQLVVASVPALLARRDDGILWEWLIERCQ